MVDPQRTDDPVVLRIERDGQTPNWRGEPTLTVKQNEMVYQHTILRQPLTIPRSSVHSVWVRRFPASRPDPKASGRWRKFVWRFQPESEIGWPISRHQAPDLGGLRRHRHRNLLIVLREPISFKGRLRVDARLWQFLIDGEYPSALPTRWTRARGFWASVPHEHAARRCLCDWPTAETIPRDVIAWLGSSTYPPEATTTHSPN